MKRLGIPLTDIPQLHQAPPNAYPKSIFEHRIPISFHKFDQIDVEEVYREFLDDEKAFPNVKDEF